jgi:hypothetical protein
MFTRADTTPRLAFKHHGECNPTIYDTADGAEVTTEADQRMRGATQGIGDERSTGNLLRGKHTSAQGCGAERGAAQRRRS